ncbi:hypothetical protein ACM66B_006299 [Microbotryomycetes sp. NB124-2]
MPNLAERLFAKTVTSSTNPTSWTPSVTSLPVGFSQLEHEFKLAPDGRGIGSVTNVRFECLKGNWCVGTLVVKRQGSDSGRGGASSASASGGPPKYSEDDSDDYDEGMIRPDSDSSTKLQGHATVVVVQRFNKSELADATRVDCSGDELNSVISIQTPDSEPMAASISYHVTLLLLPKTTHLNGFHVKADRFKVVFDPSLKQSLSIAELVIQTADAPVRLDLENCGTVEIRNENRLNPTRTSLKHHDNLVSGSLSAESIDIICANGSISGDFSTTVDSMSVSTTNFNVSGTFKSAKDLTLSTMNAQLSGTFTAHGSNGIVVELQQTKVDNSRFLAPFGSVKLVNKLSTVSAQFTIAKSLIVKTTGFPVDADVTLSPLRTLSRSSSRRRRPSSAIGVAPPSFTSSSTTTDLPTFEDVMQSDLSSSNAQQVRVHVETTEGHVNVRYLNHPKTIALQSFASTTGGSRVYVEHPAPFDRSSSRRGRPSGTNGQETEEDDSVAGAEGGFVGSFKAVTGGLTSSALVSLLNASVEVLDFTTNKRSEVSGTVPALISLSSMTTTTDATPGTPVRSSSRPQSSSGRRNPFGSSNNGSDNSPSRSIFGGRSRSESRTVAATPATQEIRGNDGMDRLERDVDQLTLAGDEQESGGATDRSSDAATVVKSFSFAASTTGPAEILFV